MFGLIIMTITNQVKLAGATAERFAALYKEYLPKIFKYVVYKVSDTPTAEDLTSRVFEKALSKFKTHDAEKSAFATWLFSIARNTVIDYYRAAGRERKMQQDSDPLLLHNEISPEETAIRAEQFRTLRVFVSRLSPHEQEIISLKFGARMTNREIAKTTGLSESNIGTTIWRTVNKLRENFREWEHG